MRRHPRAPLNSMILYLNKTHVFCSRGFDISPVGLSMENGPCPAEDGTPLLFGLVSYPDFSLMGTSPIKAFSRKGADFFFERTIFRIKARKIRTSSPCSAYEFIDASPEHAQKINRYISIFSKNILFLLGLFEDPQYDPVAARSLASLLGHVRIDEMNTLRQKILHDYQNIID